MNFGRGFTCEDSVIRSFMSTVGTSSPLGFGHEKGPTYLTTTNTG